jgi:serine protease Do
MYKKRFPIMSLFLIGVLILAALACGGTAPSATEAAADEEAAQSGGAVNTLEGVQQAVIQIEYLGSYRDPAIGAVSGAGFGSGFIIDPSGIAVTNNHVVAGAASLKIRIGGDTDKTYNAKILGVSECSDLAVIDIEGEGFPYLQWYDGEISVGMNVYAVGFPLGEPEYTLTRGVVSKASASGETAWASIDGVIGHDATINPGNSGGPLVTEDGKVVGVNYSSRPDYDQYFAISVEKALPLSTQLREGENVDSIGVNGRGGAPVLRFHRERRRVQHLCDGQERRQLRRDFHRVRKDHLHIDAKLPDCRQSPRR